MIFNTTAKNGTRVDSPIFAEQSDSGAAHGDGSARTIDVPHCESHLGTLGKIWIFDRQPQPLVPAARGEGTERRTDKRDCER